MTGLNQYAKLGVLTLLLLGIGSVTPLAQAQTFQNQLFQLAQATQTGQGFGQGRFQNREAGQNRPQGAGPLADLNLSDQQKEQLKTIMQQRKNGKQQMQDLQAKRQQLKQMIQSGSGTKEQAIALEQQINQQHSSLAQQRINNIYAIKSILTPEQFQKFQAKMAQRKAGGGQGGGFRGRQGGSFGGGQSQSTEQPLSDF